MDPIYQSLLAATTLLSLAAGQPAQPPIAPDASPLPAAMPSGAPNWIQSADGTLGTTVGTYTDCTGSAAVPRFEADVDTCLEGRIYLIGHNPGVFTPLMHMRAGDRITYYDANGLEWDLQIVQVRTWARSAGSPPLASPNVVAQLQTCEAPDGSIDRIIDLEPA